MTFFELSLEDRDLDILNNLKRWNGLPVLKDETVSHHTFHVILFSRLLAKELEVNDVNLLLNIMDFALLHDSKEMFDFDVNHKVKYNNYNGTQIRQFLDDYTEVCMMEKMNNGLNRYFLNNWKNVFVKKLVKSGDWMSCVFYLEKEKKLGNTNVEEEYHKSLMSLLCSLDDLEKSAIECKVTINRFILQDLRTFINSKLSSI